MVTRQRQGSVRLLLAALISVCLVLISLDYRAGENGPLAHLASSTKSAVAPLQSAITAVTSPVTGFFGGLAHLPSMSARNRELRQQLKVWETRWASQGFDQQQLNELRDLLGLKESLDPEGVPARVIANGVSNFEWTVTLDKGKKDGLRVGMPVISGTRNAPILIGKLVSVTKNSAEVMLINDRVAGVAGTIGLTGVSGLVKGQGPGDLTMDLVDSRARIQANEQVFTMGYRVGGEQGAFPSGLLIGAVSRSVPARPNQRTIVSIRPAADLSNLDFVLVLQTPGKDAP